MTKRHGLGRDNITVIRTRLDTDVYKPTDVEPAFVEKYSLPKKGRTIVMAIRVEKSKKPWLDNLLKFAEGVGDEIDDINVVVAGDGELLDHYVRRADEINTRRGSSIVRFIGPIFEVPEMIRLYNFADIIVGNGRGIMEAMACRKPVVVLGENGEGAAVGPENIDDVAKFNFSGRHFRHHKGACDSVSLLKELITDDKWQAKGAQFCFDYIRKYMDAEIGSKEIRAVCQRAVNRKHSSMEYLRWYVRIVKAVLGGWMSRRLGKRV